MIGVTAYPVQASMDRSARLVHRLRLRTGDTGFCSRVQTLVEEALRLTTLPGEDQGRIYLFRRLRLPALDVRDLSSTNWVSRCATHLLAMSGEAAHAEDPRAASADAVFFNSIEEPWRQLAVRLIAGDLAREWFWSEATAVPRDLPTAIRLEQTLDRWRVQADGWALVARELMPVLDVKAALALVGLLPPSACERWLGGFGRPAPVAADVPVPRVRDRMRELLHHLRLEVEPGDRRLLFLAVLAILESSPSAPQDATLPLLAARVLDEPVVRVRIVRDARGRLDALGRTIEKRIELVRPKRREGATQTISPDIDLTDTPSTEHESTLVEHRTECAGLYFLLHPLRRLGVARFVDERPELALTHFVERVLMELSAEAGVKDDDPILWPLFDGLDNARGQPLDSRVEGLRTSGHRRDTRLWARAVRMWCRKYARMTLYEIVSRPGRVYATPTSIDVTMPMSAVDVRIRRSGLDIDPGYVPWFGRVVHFHYHLEG